MQNFIGTNMEQLTEEEIFKEHQKLVVATIKRQFPNHQQFCMTHMIEFDDLVQMGNIGLLNAIRTFKNDGKVQFRTHAINNIIWEISTQAKSDSLRNINTQTFEIANVISADKVLEVNNDSYGSEPINILSTMAIPKSQETSEIGEDNVLEQQVIEFLRNDSEVDDELLFIFVSRINSVSLEAIGKQLGTHRNSVGERLQTNKAKRIKKRLQDFLRNGDSK